MSLKVCSILFEQMNTQIQYLAHTRVDTVTGATAQHDLAAHLKAVAELAARHAAGFGSDWAYLAGLWHDLGKFRPGFQAYIRLTSDAHIEGRLPGSSEKSHSAAGALHAIKAFESRFGASGGKAARILAYVIAGHHAGLADWTGGLDQRLFGTRAPDSGREHAEAIGAAERFRPDLLPLRPDFDLRASLALIPGLAGPNPLALSLWIRLLFSALVDADFLDTEAFMDARRITARSTFPQLSHFLNQLTAHLDTKTREVLDSGRGTEPVMQARALVLGACRAKALLPPGVFSLNVPTGGGKTLSSLAFALQHAVSNKKRRVIYAIPYTSIIEQTTDVFAAIFGRDALVEHHSQADVDDRRDTSRSRLACENWDVPLVVTTNVQLFESLFAARTSRCRKLHRITNSVIVLDEAQLLPPEFLQPILDALALLVAHYGVTVLLCTATQPTLTDTKRFDPRQNLRGLPPPVPLIEGVDRLARALDRVHIEWPDDLQAPLDISQLAQRVALHDSVLVIVNTRKDAAELVAALDVICGAGTLHLSAAMCGQHRADVISEIRKRLAARHTGADTRPLRVVSTQIVEAGVDIDFPVVYRALAGLDSIAQAAGRCNREGRLTGGEKGRVIVFVREVPPALHGLRAGVQATRSTLAAERPAQLNPKDFESYFPIYYDGFQSRDKHGICDHLCQNADLSMDFRSAADKFRLVDDEDQATVIAPYRSTAIDARPVAPLIEQLRSGDTDRWLLRALQRYTVTVRKRQVDDWQAKGDVKELQPGLYLLVDDLRYDENRGLLPAESSLAPARLVS